jgi:hypothetical protein
VIATVPGIATIALVTWATNPVLDPKFVGSAVPFHWMTDALVKPVPVARSVNPGMPATTQLLPHSVAWYGPTIVKVSVGGGGVQLLQAVLAVPPHPEIVTKAAMIATLSSAPIARPLVGQSIIA